MPKHLNKYADTKINYRRASAKTPPRHQRNLRIHANPRQTFRRKRQEIWSLAPGRKLSKLRKHHYDFGQDGISALAAGGEEMIIAIDFDKTFTEDPQLWLSFIHNASLRGHEIICATSRKEYSNDMNRHGWPIQYPIVYCWGQFKEHACAKAGYKVDIWIDDIPGMIQDCRILNDDIK